MDEVRVCLFGALSGLAMWLIFNSPLVGLISNIFVDFMGALPTIKKSYDYPDGENRISWVLFSLANGTNLLALNTLSFAVVVLPVYLFLLSLTITLLIFLRKKRIIIGGVVAIFVLLIFGAMTNAAVLSDASRYIVETPDNLPQAQAVLVLGAKVKSDGKMSQMLEDRVATGLQIYKTGKVQKILVSGDHGTENYDEVNTMKKYLLNAGVPQEGIFLDHAGFDTYDSMYRAREIFHVRSMIVVTQKFHLPRAIFIARSLGIEAKGYAADLRTYPGMYLNESREILARIKAWLDISTSAKPKFLGPVIPIEGDGRISWD